MEPWLKPLYDAEGMRAVDRWAIEEQEVPSLELMEAAGHAVAEAVAGLSPQGPVRVVCGKGNNAGDGFVAARHLAGMGHEVEVLLLWHGDELKGDAAVNLARVEGEHVEGELNGRLAGSGAGVTTSPKVVPTRRLSMFSVEFRDEGEPWRSANAVTASAKPVSVAVSDGLDSSVGLIQSVPCLAL